MKWTEAGTMIPRDGEPLVLIEQEDFGTVCGVLDIEGESVYRILRAVNAHDELLAACKYVFDRMERVKLYGSQERRILREAIAKAEGTADA